MPLYTFLLHLLNVLVQIANKMGLQQQQQKKDCRKVTVVVMGEKKVGKVYSLLG
jgi:hypothetical protein